MEGYLALIKEQREENDKLKSQNKSLSAENSYYKHIINELEKWLKDVDVFQMNFIENKEHITPFRVTLDKLKELLNISGGDEE